MAEKVKTHRNLPRKQFYELCQWLEKNREMIVGDKLTDEQTAKKACAELGFDASFWTVRHAKDCVGIERKRRVRKPKPSLNGHAGDALLEDVVELASRVEKLEAKVAFLVQRVDELTH